MKIAVIGSGISGNAAALSLSHDHQVTVYEKRERLGGHSATVEVEHNNRLIPVDTGFIVYNEANYPLMTAMFDYLQVKTKKSNMSFSVSLDKGSLEWCGTSLKGVFAQRRNIFSLPFLFMLREIFRFNKKAAEDFENGKLSDMSLETYLDYAGFSERFRNNYLIPMTSAIWSTPSRKMLDFPAESLLGFMKNHSLIQKQRPQWRTVDGGSREYVKLLRANTDAEYRLGAEVLSIVRTNGGVLVEDSRGDKIIYDEVVLACHSDQAFSMIKDKTLEEASILGDVEYTPNDVWLHSDPKLMPRKRDAWAAWSYMGTRSSCDERDVAVTYWMNSLQGIPDEHPMFVTLNPFEEPDPSLVHGRYQYSHPLFDKKAIAAQNRLPQIQGKNNLWFCGAWCGYGFHEDGLKSGLEVAEQLGSTIPWLRDDAVAKTNMLIADAAE